MNWTTVIVIKKLFENTPIMHCCHQIRRGTVRINVTYGWYKIYWWSISIKQGDIFFLKTWKHMTYFISPWNQESFAKQHVCIIMSINICILWKIFKRGNEYITFNSTNEYKTPLLYFLHLQPVKNSFFLDWFSGSLGVSWKSSVIPKVATNVHKAVAQDEGRAKNYEFVQKKHDFVQKNTLCIQAMMPFKSSKKLRLL